MTDEAKVKSDKRYRKMMKRNNERRRKLKMDLEPHHRARYPSEQRVRLTPRVQTVHTQRCLPKDGGGKFAQATGEHTRKYAPQLPRIELRMTYVYKPFERELERESTRCYQFVGLHRSKVRKDKDKKPILIPRYAYRLNSWHSKESPVKIDRLEGGRPMSDERIEGVVYIHKDHQGKPCQVKYHAKQVRVPTPLKELFKENLVPYDPPARVIRKWTRKAKVIVKAMPVLRKRLTNDQRISRNIAILLAGDAKDEAYYDSVDKRREAQEKNRMLTDLQRAGKQDRARVKEEAKQALKPLSRVTVKVNTMMNKKERYAHMMYMRDLASVKRSLKKKLHKDKLNANTLLQDKEAVEAEAS